MQESQENIALIEGLQPFSTYGIQIAVTNYYSDSLEHLPSGKEIWGQTKSGGEFWAWCRVQEWNFVIYVRCMPLFFI